MYTGRLLASSQLPCSHTGRCCLPTLRLTIDERGVGLHRLGGGALGLLQLRLELLDELETLTQQRLLPGQLRRLESHGARRKAGASVAAPPPVRASPPLCRP